MQTSLRHPALVGVCLGVVLLLTGCANPQGDRLDTLLQDLQYRQAGPVATTSKTDTIDSHARRITYTAAKPYDVLKQRLARLGYTCQETAHTANSANARCEAPRADMSVSLSRYKQTSGLTVSIP